MAIDHAQTCISPEMLRDWVAHRACRHHDMREFATILDADWEYKHPLLAYYADEFRHGDYPALKSVLDGPSDGNVLMRQEIAIIVLRELARLWSHQLPGTTTVLVDEWGARVWPFLEPDGLDVGRGFTPIYCRPRLETGRTDLLQVGVEGVDLVVRSAMSHEELLRSPTLLQGVGTKEIAVDDFIMTDVVYRDPGTRVSVRGYADPIRHYRESNLREPDFGRDYVRIARVREVSLTLAGSLPFPRLLQAAAEACLRTSNPVVLARHPPELESLEAN